jgi:HD domain
VSASEQLRQVMLRLGGELGAHDLEPLRVPDSRAARAADALAAESQTVSLTNHGVRSYGFGALLGLGEGRTFDAEVLYVAAILHDIGLMPAFDRGGRFEDDGDVAVRELLADVGWEPARAERAGKAVRDHWDGPQTEDEVESLLLAYGTSVDVSGRRFDELSSATLEAFLDAAPRCGFKEHFVELVEGKVSRGGDDHLERIAKGGFADRVRSSPFPE